ncbi:MAG: helix-turn-helix transcriptional regulator [Xanthomonadales bacterium]|nr:helix-turn-helix transcriptional regulator [Xanthomonadales bacterium]
MGKRKLSMTNRVKELRAEAGGMTQQQLADLVGVTRQTVNVIEANKYSPSLEVAFLIAQSLQVQLEDVFGFIED